MATLLLAIAVLLGVICVVAVFFVGDESGVRKN